MDWRELAWCVTCDMILDVECGMERGQGGMQPCAWSGMVWSGLGGEEGREGVEGVEGGGEEGRVGCLY